MHEEAIKEFLIVIKLEKDNPGAHYHLGVAREQLGQFENAIAEYKEVIRIKKGNAPLARNNLRRAEQMAHLDKLLTAILHGGAQPRDANEQLALAIFCEQPPKRFYYEAARFYAAAFAAQPRIAGVEPSHHRYNAACDASLAAAGKGNDAATLDAQERARLRQQALDWLRADLQAYRRLMEQDAAKAAPETAKRLQHWLQDEDFAGVRGNTTLVELPEIERGAWRQLWADVAKTLAEAQGKAPGEKKADAKP
jgi:hypothetical protein